MSKALLPIAEFDFVLTRLDRRALHVHMRKGKTSVYGVPKYVPNAELETFQRAFNVLLEAALAFMDTGDKEPVS